MSEEEEDEEFVLIEKLSRLTTPPLQLPERPTIAVDVVHTSDVNSYRRELLKLGGLGRLRPQSKYWLGPIDEYHCGLLFMPLSLVSILCSVGIIGWGYLNLVEVFTSDGRINWDETGDVLVGVFKIGNGLLALAGVAFRWALGVHCQLIGLEVLIVSSLVNGILKTCEWSMAAAHVTTNADPVFTAQDRVFMAWYYTELLLLFVCIPLFVAGPILSLHKVIECGGHGWEYKNYLQVLWDTQVENALKQKMDDRWKRWEQRTNCELLPPPRFALLQSTRHAAATRAKSYANVKNEIERRRVREHRKFAKQVLEG